MWILLNLKVIYLYIAVTVFAFLHISQFEEWVEITWTSVQCNSLSIRAHAERLRDAFSLSLVGPHSQSLRCILQLTRRNRFCFSFQALKGIICKLNQCVCIDRSLTFSFIFFIIWHRPHSWPLAFWVVASTMCISIIVFHFVSFVIGISLFCFNCFPEFLEVCPDEYCFNGGTCTVDFVYDKICM